MHIEPQINELLIEANVNLMCAESIYKHIRDTKLRNDKLEFLRLTANNSCDRVLLNIATLLSTKKNDASKDEISLLILDEKDELIKEIRELYKQLKLEEVRHKSVAHKTKGHPNPAGNLNGLLDKQYMEKLRDLLNILILYFERKYNWDTGYSSAGKSAIKGLSEILKSI